MNVVGRREQRVALAGCQRLLFCDLENGLFRIAPIIKATINGLVLGPPIDADDAPGEMIVHRRFGADRHDQGKQAERAVPRPVKRILSDASAHAARFVRAGTCLGQPSIGGEQLLKRRPQRFDAVRVVVKPLSDAACFGNELPNLRCIDQKPETLDMMVARITHTGSLPGGSYSGFGSQAFTSEATTPSSAKRRKPAPAVVSGTERMNVLDSSRGSLATFAQKLFHVPSRRRYSSTFDT